MAEDEQDERNRTIYLTLDPAFEAYCLENYDLNGDGRFSRYEAERVVTVDCSGRGIESLGGIEYFTALRYLNCSGNRLTSLDVAPLLSLETLDCSQNTLFVLTLGMQRRLERLQCADNRIGGLDLAYTVSLTELDCSGNELTVLDISNCARRMEWVDVSRNDDLTLLYKDAAQQIDRLTLAGGTEVVEQ